MSTFQLVHDDVDALRSDGGIVHIRDLGPADVEALHDLHARASDRSIYFRYFSENRAGAEHYLPRLAQAPGRDHHAIGALSRSRLLGVGVFERIDPHTAEFALLVADDAQHAGIGTLLLEHLVAAARAVGIQHFVGEVLSENNLMLEVVRDLGLVVNRTSEQGSTHIEFSLEPADRVVAAIEERERTADAASLDPILRPRSVAVVGAGRRSGAVGHEVLRNILEAGFTGTVYAVNPNHSSVLGVPCAHSVADLPEPVDLVVIAIPAGQVPEALQAAGERGCRGAVILGAGFGEAGHDGIELQNEVLAVARGYGMRIVGPNCIGLLNTDPDVRLDATFAVLSRRPGRLALVAQSGAFGVALLTAADQLGLGVSQFVSVGNKADVGGNDLLLSWADDPRTRVIGMYLESIGDPRRFARIARRVSRRKPILAVKSGRTDAGRRAGASHTAAAASPEVAIDALFRGSGVLRLRTMGQLMDSARVLTDQPLPLGPRLAIVGNSGGPEILAADAAADAGLAVEAFDEATTAALRDAGLPTQNPIDLGAAAQPDVVEQVLRILLGSASVDMVLSVFTGIAVTDASDIRDAVVAAAATADKTTVAVEVGAPEVTVPVPGRPWSLPFFTFPEPAAAALGVAVDYARLRSVPEWTPARPDDVDRGAARELVRVAVASGASWLNPEQVDRLLNHYGIVTCPQRLVASADAAAAAAAEFGYPVALKLGEPGLHKSDLGGVRLGLADETAVRAAVAELNVIRGLTSETLLLQAMQAPGTELIVGAVHDAQFGPLVMVGAGGVLTEVLGDRRFALAPLSLTDADDLIANLRSSRLLDGYRGARAASRTAVRDVVIRIASMVDDLPQIAELDLNPLVCRGDEVVAVDARIRVALPPYHPDPLVRQLRAPRAL